MSDQKPAKNPFEDLDRNYAEQEMENGGLPPYSSLAADSSTNPDMPPPLKVSDSKKTNMQPKADIYDAPEVVPQPDRETLPEVVVPQASASENQSSREAGRIPPGATGPAMNFPAPGYYPNSPNSFNPDGSVAGSSFPGPMQYQNQPAPFNPDGAFAGPSGGQPFPAPMPYQNQPNQFNPDGSMAGPPFPGPIPYQNHPNQFNPDGSMNGPSGPPFPGPMPYGGPPTPFNQDGSMAGPPFPGPSHSPYQSPPPQNLPLPQDRTIAIPAVDSEPGSPLVRAYVPILQKYNLPKESFMRFLDSLNEVMTTNPPMQVLDVTGGILKSVPILFPLHWIGSAFSGLANMSESGRSKGRSDATLRQANKDIFGPRGLKAELANLDALAYIAKIPILDSQGKVNKSSPLARRLKDLSRASRDSFAESKEQGQSIELDLQQQRLQVLQPWIADLRLDVTPWTAKSKLTRFNSALKKYNDPRKDRNYRANPNEEVKDRFRKCIWLVIREVDGANGQSSAGPSR